MKNEDEPLKLDCIEMKRKIQAKIHEETKGMTVEEELAYYREAVEKGPFKDLWKQLKDRDEAEITRKRIAG